MSSHARNSGSADAPADPDNLRGKEKRWIRINIELASALVDLQQPFDNLDVLEAIRQHDHDNLTDDNNTRVQQRYSPFVGDRRGGDRVYYQAKPGAKEYVAEFLSEEREFGCCDYPDGFVTKSGGLFCKYCGAELDRETVREADL